MRMLGIILAAICLSLFTLLSIARTSPDNASSIDNKVVARTQHVSLAQLANISRSLAFEPNRGQAAANIRYLAHASGYDFLLTDQEIAFSPTLPPNTKVGAIVPQPESVRSYRADAKSAKPGILTLRLVGSQNSKLTFSRLGPLPGRTNYLIGNDPLKWRTNIATFSRLAEHSAWPGITLVWYGNQNQVEGDFVVAPGASPTSIQFGLDGSVEAAVDSNGDLTVGSFRFHKPLTYQTDGARKRPVDGRYVLTRSKDSSTHVGFEIASYDRSKPLVIDPLVTQAYSTVVGGVFGDSYANAIAVDRFGSAYITGDTVSSTFPTTARAYDTNCLADGTCAGTFDVFITKLNESGTAVEYSTYLGGNMNDFGNGIAVDQWGNAYITGYTGSTDFPTTPNAFQTSFGEGLEHAFITKLNVTGSALTYSTFLRGSFYDSGTGIVVDKAGQAFVTGGTESSDFPTTPGAYRPLAPVLRPDPPARMTTRSSRKSIEMVLP